MNTSKHTPGPWKCVDPHVIRGPKNVVVAKTLDSKEGYEIKQANAHLIAAAPAMYEALQAMCKQARVVMQFTNAYDGQLIQAIANGEAALAQAEGK